MFCRQCGTNHQREDKFCSACGQALSPEASVGRHRRSLPPSHKLSTSFYQLLTGAMAVLFLLLLGITGYFYVNAPSEEAGQPAPAAEEEPVTTTNLQTEEEEAEERQQLIEEFEEKVMMIETRYGGGSGFLYNEQGDIITNAHVINGAEEVQVTLDDETTYSGEVIGESDDIDIALIRVDELAGQTPLPLQTDEQASVGEEVLALGNPLGLQNSVTDGIISGVERDLDIPPYTYENTYQISAPVDLGNSGGPLVSELTGKVIGVNSAAVEGSSIGFSIPVTEIHELVDDWVKEEREG
ncbi:trypsin-like peptidase domain-containing protein [Salsuginibacillus kocurii]|uniref:trypsin-like peptidase domain-containing protein n=1 Tax=Salsuginibacillus kocurii TaxID=427078 RepID=UPI000372B092|nr:trypsin-like peptidase domain-containing protein [Salsuginibacillus kocurii]